MIARIWPSAVSPQSSIWPRLLNRSTFKTGGKRWDYPVVSVGTPLPDDAQAPQSHTMEGVCHLGTMTDAPVPAAVQDCRASIQVAHTHSKPLRARIAPS